MTDEKKKLGDGDPDEETQQILDEIAEEEKGDKKEEEEEKSKEDEKDSEDEKKDKDSKEIKKDEESKKPPHSERSIRSIPFGRFEKEKSKREKAEADLQALKDAKDEEKKGGEKVDLKEAFKEIAESLNVEPDVVEKMYKAFTTIPGDKKPELSQEISKKLDSIDKTKQQLEWQNEDRKFVKEFKRDILPEIKKLYPEISRTDIIKVMRKLHTIAFSEEYHLVPRLKSVFRAVPEEFAFLEGKKGGEGGKSAGTIRKDKKDLNRELSEEEVEDLSDEEFDRYSNNMANSKGKSKLRIVYTPKPR
jgi:hypothetical protein